MTNHESTSDEILDGVHRALNAHDMPAAAALIRRLAVVDPTAAATIVAALDAARTTPAGRTRPAPLPHGTERVTGL